MWKKEQGEAEAPTPGVSPEGPKAPGRKPLRTESSPDRASATIGRAISIRGDVNGDEDLLIQGRIDGSVNLKQHAVTVGPEGEVNATIEGRIVTVQGTVEGNLKAEEQVILRSSAHVTGDIVAPRVVLEDGARFRGGIDMGESVETSRRPGVTALPEQRTPRPDPDKGPSQKATDPAVEVRK